MPGRLALEVLPDGLGDDPISSVIAVPFLLVSGVLALGTLLELLVQSVLVPVVFLLRLGHALPWPIEVIRDGQVESLTPVRGLLTSARMRRDLDARLRIAPSRPPRWQQHVATA